MDESPRPFGLAHLEEGMSHLELGSPLWSMVGPEARLKLRNVRTRNVKGRDARGGRLSRSFGSVDEVRSHQAEGGAVSHARGSLDGKFTLCVYILRLGGCRDIRTRTLVA